MAAFNVEIDDVVPLVGPDTLNAECTMGLPCEIPVTGFSVESSSSLLIIPGGSACGADDAAAIARWDANDQTPAVNYIAWDSMEASSVVGGAGESGSASYDFGIPVEGAPGPSYKICWSHDSLAAADHLVELGVFTLNGPAIKDFTCYIGGQCELLVDGYGFAPENELVIVYGPYDQIEGTGWSGAGCGDAYFVGGGAPVEGQTPGVMPASLSYAAATSGATQSLYQIGQAFGPVGDHYKLCWSHAPSVNIPAGLTEYKVTVTGRFTLAYPVDDGNVWDEASSPNSGSGEFLGKKRDDVPPLYHDDATGLDVVFQPPSGNEDGM
jgi:hypothetical protein